MHSYIRADLVHDFSKTITFDDVYDDIVENYRITNILDYFSQCIIAKNLLEDYEQGRANYKSYIEEGMDARILMELRKSAIIPVEEKMNEYYTDHSKCETVQDIKNMRIQKLNYLNPDYIDENWQYYMLAKYCLCSHGIGLVIDFESCYTDGDWRLETTEADYRRGFLEQHIPPERLKWIV